MSRNVLCAPASAGVERQAMSDPSDPSTPAPDPWAHLRRHTAARIALGRAGGSLPTAEVLDFAAAHAAARDAVRSELDVPALKAALRAVDLPVVELATAAPDRRTYLQRPDLGRRLDAASAKRVSRTALQGACDVCVIVADGLSALAAQRQAPLLLELLIPMLRNGHGLCVSAVYVVRHGRVAVQDEIGAAVGARVALVLIGERPGLGTPDSLGAYMVYDPRPGRTDADRNCVSNIRPGGLSFPTAAETLRHLITRSLAGRISGVGLKDDRPVLERPPAAAAISGT